MILNPTQQAGAWLMMKKCTQAGTTFGLTGTVTIGRDAGSTVRLDDSATSRQHAVIEERNGKYVLFDVGSRGGTQVNGAALGGLPLQEGSAGTSIALSDSDLTIGRDPGADNTKLDDPAISRAHALVRRTESGYVVHDLGSANGTTVDGTPTPSAELAEGDMIRIGDTELQFVTVQQT
jgi:pSer/pThr/pTyr-binding forkhead associated (FHA) protein